eukprot:7193302-Prymnesium_polylepis.1
MRRRERGSSFIEPTSLPGTTSARIRRAARFRASWRSSDTATSTYSRQTSRATSLACWMWAHCRRSASFFSRCTRLHTSASGSQTGQD